MKAHLPKWVLYSIGTTWLVTCLLFLFLLHTAESLRPQPQGTWLMTHIVSPTESSSTATIEYLIKRKASPHFEELVILTSTDPSLIQRLKVTGYASSLQDEEFLKKALVGFKTPYFVLMSPRDEGVFAGTLSQPQDDIRVAQSFYAVRSTASFPSSCGNSMRAGSLFNPRTLLDSKK